MNLNRITERVIWKAQHPRLDTRLIYTAFEIYPVQVHEGLLANPDNIRFTL